MEHIDPSLLFLLKVVCVVIASYVALALIPVLIVVFAVGATFIGAITTLLAGVALHIWEFITGKNKG
jgi:hypothetical protein